MTTAEYYKNLTDRFPYLKNVHGPKDFADCVSYEESKECNKSFFEKLNSQ